MEKTNKNLRFGNSVHNKVGELLLLEVKDAEDWFNRSVQEENFAEEYRLLKKGKGTSSSSKLICLQPTMDDYGIMRGNSSIVNAELLPIETRSSYSTSNIMGYKVYH